MKSNLKEIERRFVDEIDNWLLTEDEDAKEDMQYSAQELVMSGKYKAQTIRALYEKICGHELSLANTMRHASQIERVKSLYKKGSKIKLVKMEKDPRPLADGSIGTVDHVDDIGTIHCTWEDGRMLGVVVGVDEFEIAG